ncbi:ATP-binding protein [Evansella tamaricis]|uniref:Response regulator n=1 Tax=Evansella tamaricis TaxID=2069301 RepID=A0ABS6JE84_9BACI|nr:ATP-binding protein [Evansella tamaricis]MBU9711157.1 response regulator [Evansella tamaricis]
MFRKRQKPFFGLRKRYFLPIVCISFLFIVIGSAITYNHAQTQNELMEKRNEIEMKEEVLQQIEYHLNKVIMRARGFYAFQNESELTQLYIELESLNHSIKALKELPYDSDITELETELNAFYLSYTEEILPVAIAYVKANDYESLRQFGNNGPMQEVNDFINYMELYLQAAVESRKDIHDLLLLQVQRQRRILLALTAFVLLVFVLTTSRILRYISSPLEELTEASDALARGEDIHLNAAYRKDEMGMLAKSFITMAKTVNQKNQELLVRHEKAETERQLNQDIIDHVNEGIQFVNSEGMLIHFNEKFCDLVQCKKLENLEDRSFSQWVHFFIENAVIKDPQTAKEVHSFFQEAIERNHPGIRQYRYKTVRNLVVDVYASPVFRGEEQVGTIFVHRDITKQYEIDEMKTELVSTVSHELRTPLSSVLGFAELLLEKELSPERQKKYIQTIYKEANRLTNLINAFLDLQKMESGTLKYQKEAVYLVDILKDVIDVFKLSHPDHEFILLKEDLGKVYGDKEKLTQLYMNFVSNAVKFSPNGGRIQLSVTKEENQLITKIMDEGIGIPEKDIPKLFNKFYRVDNSATRKIGGTGLGLAIAKEIIMAHEGMLVVESKIGEGSTFLIRFPVWEEELVQDNKVKNISVTDKDLVMVVEDDSSLAMLLTEELNNHGFEVIHFYDPEEALMTMGEVLPDGIVLDLMFQGETDGWEFLRKLKQNKKWKNIPVFISSALDEVIDKSKLYGIEDYFTKPYPAGRLSEVIRERLRNQSKKGQIALPKKEDRMD